MLLGFLINLIPLITTQHITMWVSNPGGSKRLSAMVPGVVAASDTDKLCS